MLKPSMQDFKHDLTSMGCCCCCCVASVVSDSVRPHRRQPTRLPHPWDSPGKNTGVGCHCLLQCMKVKSESKVTQSCPTLSDPMDCSPPGSSIHGIFQARVLDWGAIAFSDWDNHMVFIFNLLMWCITLIYLQILKNPCILGIKPTWSRFMIFLICCWILLARILLRIFTSMFISVLACSVQFSSVALHVRLFATPWTAACHASLSITNWPVVFFFCGNFVWFWYYGDGGLIEWIWEFSFLCNFLEEFE